MYSQLMKLGLHHPTTQCLLCGQTDMEPPGKQKPTEEWVLFKSPRQSQVTSNCANRQPHEPALRNGFSQGSAQDFQRRFFCFVLFFPVFFHLWKLIQSYTSYFPQNSAVRHERHLVLSHNCSWLVSAVVKACAQLKLKKKRAFLSNNGVTPVQ